VRPRPFIRCVVDSVRVTIIASDLHTYPEYPAPLPLLKAPSPAPASGKPLGEYRLMI
jgi:hypothetical protein